MLPAQVSKLRSAKKYRHKSDPSRQKFQVYSCCTNIFTKKLWAASIFTKDMYKLLKKQAYSYTVPKRYLQACPVFGGEYS